MPPLEAAAWKYFSASRHKDHSRTPYAMPHAELTGTKLEWTTAYAYPHPPSSNPCPQQVRICVYRYVAHNVNRVYYGALSCPRKLLNHGMLVRLIGDYVMSLQEEDNNVNDVRYHVNLNGCLSFLSGYLYYIYMYGCG